jgi:hypothetical protein
VYKRALAAMWVVWCFWLVLRPRGPSEVEFSDDARITLSVFGFLIVFALAYGLFREWRWPVTASRGLMMALVLGVVVGPAGRDGWVYAIDLFFAATGSLLAYWLIRVGPRPLTQARRDRR